ncbi:unnamed protein product (macronuclear) [Paramecium tetraurelia]|uniref:Uncharacterized protein n=1 Tax=Paramecium tetraurelia TaxID=5888 RepID=A0DWH9_PARTE|nr:uncharacterized protein GSPATT00021038001 [Paramecium tetraurelia]CAK87396.1 unnamed protein product [Paramecium tetraurelia]|eukprot:XP_001454793.1 hypothetical protein (macronuclear) [Paramecium tetraurelia strain d4-2]
MIAVTDYDATYNELQAKRKFLDESIHSMQDQSDHKINQALIKLTTEQLKQLKLEKQSYAYKYIHQEFSKAKSMKFCKEIEIGMLFEIHEDKLYQTKTNLQTELLAFIPSVGLRHKRLLQQEQVDVKIRRHKHQNEEKLRQQQLLRGIGDQEMKQISQNLSKYAKNDEMNSPKQDDNNLDNGSLVMSKSFNQSQPRQIQQQSQMSQNLTPVVQKQFQQKPLRGQISSQLVYGDYEDEDDLN